MFIYLICFVVLLEDKRIIHLFIYLFTLSKRHSCFSLSFAVTITSTTIATTAGSAAAAASSSFEFKCTKLSDPRQRATRQRYHIYCDYEAEIGNKRSTEHNMSLDIIGRRSETFFRIIFFGLFVLSRWFLLQLRRTDEYERDKKGTMKNRIG